MEGYKSHNPNKVDIVNGKGKSIPLNEDPANGPSTVSGGGPKPPHISHDVRVMELKDYEYAQREYDLMHIS